MKVQPIVHYRLGASYYAIFDGPQYFLTGFRPIMADSKVIIEPKRLDPIACFKCGARGHIQLKCRAPMDIPAEVAPSKKSADKPRAMDVEGPNTEQKSWPARTQGRKNGIVADDAMLAQARQMGGVVDYEREQKQKASAVIEPVHPQEKASEKVEEEHAPAETQKMEVDEYSCGKDETVEEEETQSEEVTITNEESMEETNREIEEEIEDLEPQQAEMDIEVDYKDASEHDEHHMKEEMPSVPEVTQEESEYVFRGTQPGVVEEYQVEFGGLRWMENKFPKTFYAGSSQRSYDSARDEIGGGTPE